VRPKLRYNAHRIVQSARDELEDSGEVYYAHHLLYERIADVDYPTCSPKGLLRALSAKAAPSGTTTQRIFEDL
jgi:hypothetical protein